MTQYQMNKFINEDVSITKYKLQRELTVIMDSKSHSRLLLWKDIKSFIEEEEEIKIITCGHIEESSNEIYVLKFTKNANKLISMKYFNKNRIYQISL